MTKTAIHGWVILDKPSGITSAHAVAKVKRMLRPEKIGHAGTLDPLASGILPLALGEATKTVPYMMDAEKTYGFTVIWGVQTDTDDSEGQVVARSENRPKKEDILYILPDFMGDIQQLPPNYSALKVDGKRAYELAREGKEVELKPRQVTVHSLELVDYDAEKASFICRCSKGTYVRSLARDIGLKLGCLGHISVLRRLAVGHFTENHAISLEVLHEMVHNGATKVWPVDAALDDILAWEITPDQATLLKAGRVLPFSGIRAEETPITLLARCEGRAVAICEGSQGTVKPVRVFNL